MIFLVKIHGKILWCGIVTEYHSGAFFNIIMKDLREDRKQLKIDNKVDIIINIGDLIGSA